MMAVRKGSRDGEHIKGLDILAGFLRCSLIGQPNTTIRKRKTTKDKLEVEKANKKQIRFFRGNAPQGKWQRLNEDGVDCKDHPFIVV